MEDPTVVMCSVQCYECGVVFCMPDKMQKNRAENKKPFWCPNGHEQSYVGPPLREQLDAAKQAAIFSVRREEIGYGKLERALEKLKNLRKKNRKSKK